MRRLSLRWSARVGSLLIGRRGELRGLIRSRRCGVIESVQSWLPAGFLELLLQILQTAFERFAMAGAGGCFDFAQDAGALQEQAFALTIGLHLLG